MRNAGKPGPLTYDTQHLTSSKVWKLIQALVQTKEAKSGPPENMVLFSIASEAWFSSLTMWMQMDDPVNQRQDVKLRE